MLNFIVPTKKENIMQVVNIRKLKTNPSVALREAKKVMGKSPAEMLTLVSEMGIPVVDYSAEEAEAEVAMVETLVREHQAKMFLIPHRH
jgi:predicted HTH domain antitoxin